MPLKTDRTLCTAKEAAEIFGCTAGRIRQLKIAGELWSHLLDGHLLVFDLDEIRSKAQKPVARGRPRRNAVDNTRYKWVSVAEACDLAGCSGGWRRHLLREGKLPSSIRLDGWTWMIDRQDAINLRSTLSARSIGSRESKPAQPRKRRKTS